MSKIVDFFSKATKLPKKLFAIYLSLLDVGVNPSIVGSGLFQIKHFCKDFSILPRGLDEKRLNCEISTKKILMKFNTRVSYCWSFVVISDEKCPNFLLLPGGGAARVT